MKKVLTVVLSLILISCIVFISVSAKTIDDKKVVVNTYNNTSYSNDESSEDIDEKIIPSDYEIDKQIKEIPIKKFEAVTKNDFYKKVLNSIDYFSCANGTIETNMINGTDSIIEYNLNMANCTGYQHVIGADFDIETIVSDFKVYTIDNINKTRNYFLEVAKAKSDECNNLGEVDTKERITNAIDEFKTDDSEDMENLEWVPVYHYRLNPTNLHYASTVSLFPQEIAFGFLANEELWEISDKTDFLGRKCIIISGITEREYGEKLNVEKFVMTIDNETGILLNFEGYDTDGYLTNYSKTTDINFDEVEIKKFDLSDYEDYKAE